MDQEHHKHNAGLSHTKMNHNHSSHDMTGHAHGGMIQDFKRRFIISLILTLPVLLLSPMMQETAGFHLSFAYSGYVLFFLSSAIFLYGGWPFLEGLVSELKERKPGMMTLIGVAIAVAYLYSSAVIFGLQGMDFFWELATLIVIMLLGHWIEMKSVSGASRALELLVQMLPATAHKTHGDHVMDVNINELSPGDTILVKPGEKIPADGEIIDGESYINESMLTGESKPVQRKIHEQVIGGAINGNGSLKIRVVHTGKDSYLSKVIHLVEEAQKTKSNTQHLADRAAFWLTIFALAGGIGTLIAWLALGKEFSFALERMVTVMVISCPHALGLAIPLVVAISTALSAQKGLLIRNRTAFENARKITTIVFDKTGTLTSGEFGVTRYESLLRELSNDDILKLASALEQNSEHPIAQGILIELKKKNLNAPKAEHFKAITGKGIQASVEGKNILVVSPGYLEENNLPIPEKAISSSAETIVFVIINKEVAGYIALADKIRPESAEAIRVLKELGIKTMMLTGDNKKVAESVSNELKLDGFFAEVLPHQKLEKIKQLQSKGEFVAMTGDGVNDAPALAQADIGIAVGSGTDIAAETADIILVQSNPKDIVSLILFGKATYRKMIQNLVWATAYNAITLPLATGFISGIIITPAIGALFMSLSTIIVAINAQTLKKIIKHNLKK
ncbi:MAG: copper-translocating P-type ATPase [Bacteroidia bacterium]